VHIGLDVVGLIPGVGEIADGANALIYLAEGDKVNAALSAAAMIPGAGMAATGAKYAKKAVGVGVEAGAKLSKEAAEKLAKEAAEKAAKEKVAKEAAEAEVKNANQGNKGGKDKGNPRCVLRPRFPDTCPPRTGHHVVPDRVFQIGGRTKGTRLPGGLTEAQGLVICVDGGTPKPTNEHGKIHGLYDLAEKRIGLLGSPPGTAKLATLEVAGAAAAAKVTGCNAAWLASQLRLYHQANGMGPGFVVRADKMGSLANKLPMSTFGSKATPGSGAF
jgi:hypothetical protein